MLQNLDDARLLIDQGNFTRAVQVCEDHLRAAGASAHAYCLLGMAWERQGDKSLAGEHYRRALYLDPEHEEALRQWATLLERAGENNRAKNLQRRMERLTAETAG
jgi:chemotaxis protein methyltransferase WspC